MNALEKAGVDYYLAVEEFVKGQPVSMRWLIDRVLGQPDSVSMEAYGPADFEKKFKMVEPLASREQQTLCLEEEEGFRAIIPLAEPVGLGSLGAIEWVEIYETDRNDPIEGITAAGFCVASLAVLQVRLDTRSVDYYLQDGEEGRIPGIGITLDDQGRGALISESGMEREANEYKANGIGRAIRL